MLVTFCCSLLTANCLLLTVYCLLLTPHSSLLTNPSRPPSMTGTLTNALTVLLGGLLGLWLGNRFPERMQETTFVALGLFTLAIGLSASLSTGNPLIVLFSLVIGGLIGEALRVEARLNGAGEWLQRHVARESGGEEGDGRFVNAFVTASLVFCVGPLTFQGAIEEGLTGDPTLLIIKSMLDGFAALAFATTMGPGVLASILVVLGLQGSLTFLASLGSSFFTPPMIAELTATGGIVLMTISLILLELRPVRAANLLPALLVAPALVALLDTLGIPYYPV